MAIGGGTREAGPEAPRRVALVRCDQGRRARLSARHPRSSVAGRGALVTKQETTMNHGKFYKADDLVELIHQNFDGFWF